MFFFLFRWLILLSGWWSTRVTGRFCCSSSRWTRGCTSSSPTRRSSTSPRSPSWSSSPTFRPFRYQNISLRVMVNSTGYTQSGDCRFLAYIPSWWKNQSWLVRLGVHAHPLLDYYHHVQSCIVRSCWEGRYTSSISSLPLWLYVLCG